MEIQQQLRTLGLHQTEIVMYLFLLIILKILRL